MYDVITFGEAMLRLSPPGYKRIEQADIFNASIGGGELNVAVGTARLGLNSAWLSLLPDSPLGYLTRNKVLEAGVNTSLLKFSKKGRMGQYFVEFGASPRRTKVIYDRKLSSISLIEEDDFNFKEILKTKLFHVSGITPALSEGCKLTTNSSIVSAKENGATVSFDINYRERLWSEDEAKKCLTPLMEYVDILITTEEDTERVFKITGKNYFEVAEKLLKKFNFEVVAITLRENISVWKNSWTAIAYDGGRFYDDKKYQLEIVDRFGGGDSFSAGFIYGYLTGDKDIEVALKYGNAFSALKQTNPTDFSWASLDEVKSLIGQKTLRVER